LPRRSIGAKAGQSLVTAKFYIFFTISIQYFENTHQRPLPLNHLRKMQEKTVKFLIDIAPPANLSAACLDGGGSLGEGGPTSERHRRPADILLPSIEAIRQDRLGRFTPRLPDVPGRLASCQPFANLCQPMPT
jgi:hypothetical protein